MKKIFLLLTVLLSVGLLYSQNKAEAEKLVEEGVKLHDKGQFEAAIAKYDKALEVDKNNLLALAEKAYSLTSLGKLEDVLTVCQKAIDVHVDDEGLRMVFITYGNAYDALKKPYKSIEVYDEGLKKFPDYYFLYFNKGVTLSGLNKDEEALECFIKSAGLNPYHPGTQNAIARTLASANKRIPALMAFCWFQVLEPAGSRAEKNLPYIRSIISGGAKKTGKNSITINIDSDVLADTNADGSNSENNFSTVDFTLSLSGALDFDKKNSKKNEVELFIGKIETLCSILDETKEKNSGFYWDYYVPFFIELKKRKFIEPFSYIVFYSSGDDYVKKWVKKHDEEMDDFYKWANGFEWRTK